MVGEVKAPVEGDRLVHTPEQFGRVHEPYLLYRAGL